MKKKIPKFKNEAEERLFWQKHDSSEYVDWSDSKNVVMPKLDEAVKSQKTDGFVERSSSRRANLSGVRRTYVRRSDFEMQRNAEIGLSTEPSNLSFRPDQYHTSS